MNKIELINTLKNECMIPKKEAATIDKIAQAFSAVTGAEQIR